MKEGSDHMAASPVDGITKNISLSLSLSIYNPSCFYVRISITQFSSWLGLWTVLHSSVIDLRLNIAFVGNFQYLLPYSLATSIFVCLFPTKKWSMDRFTSWVRLFISKVGLFVCVVFIASVLGYYIVVKSALHFG